MFTYPVTEIFSKDGKGRCVFSQEEYDLAIASGMFTDNQPDPEPPPASTRFKKAA